MTTSLQMLQSLACDVIEMEGQAVLRLKDRIDEQFAAACQVILDCQGRVVVTGMGKSGHIGGKIAATLASTGTPSFFVHPGEASHGDLGMMMGGDVVLAISNSGETDELLTILPMIKRLGIPLITMTGNAGSRLSVQADVNLDIGVEKEACPLNLAPTTSTTVTLALGDALAVSLLGVRGFTAEDFARSHPGGKLGRRLLLTVGDLMHLADRIPKVAPDAVLRDVLVEISKKSLGFAAVVDAEDHLLGVYTDGDLRRTLDQDVSIKEVCVQSVMTVPGASIQAAALAVEALNLMEEKSIFALPVVDSGDRVIGALHMHDLLRAGVV